MVAEWQPRSAKLKGEAAHDRDSDFMVEILSTEEGGCCEIDEHHRTWIGFRGPNSACRRGCFVFRLENSTNDHQIRAPQQ